MINHPIILKFFSIHPDKNLLTNYHKILRHFQVKLIKIYVQKNYFRLAEFLIEKLEKLKREDRQEIDTIQPVTKTAENLFATEEPKLESDNDSLDLSFGSDDEEEDAPAPEPESAPEATEPVQNPQPDSLNQTKNSENSSDLPDHQKSYLESLLKLKRPLYKVANLQKPLNPYEVPYFKNIIFDQLENYTADTIKKYLLINYYNMMLTTSPKYFQHSYNLLVNTENNGATNQLPFNFKNFSIKLLNSSFRKLIKNLEKLKLNPYTNLPHEADDFNLMFNSVDQQTGHEHHENFQSKSENSEVDSSQDSIMPPPNLINKNELKLINYFESFLISYDSMILMKKLIASSGSSDNIWPTESLDKWTGPDYLTDPYLDASTLNSMPSMQ